MPADSPRPADVPPETVPLGTALARAALDRPVTEVAPWLLGRVLLCAGAGGLVAVRLTEVEAYDGERDPGSHAFRGRTARNATMFGPAGHAYVYFTYGMHWCVNVVCGPIGSASAVLLRAGEVVRGREVARARRPSARADRDLARGPARLTVALGIDGSRDGTDLLGGDAAAPGGPSTTAAAGEAPLLRLLSGVPAPASAVDTGPRVGVGGAGADLPWRFWLAGDPTVSVYRPHAPRRRRPSTPTALADPSADATVRD